MAQSSASTAPSLPARDLRNGWGICGSPGIDAPVETYARMMDRIGTRDIRGQIYQQGVSGIGRFQALQSAMANAGMSSPVPHVTALVTAYLDDPYTNWDQQRPNLLAFAATGMLRAIEGPNEVNDRYEGNGAHGPYDFADRTGPYDYAANFGDWATVIGQFKWDNWSALQNVAVVSPTIASGMPEDYGQLPNVSNSVDAVNFHFYAGGGQQPSLSFGYNPAVGYFSNILGWAANAEGPGRAVWLTESGATTTGYDYARDGISQAKYIANQFFDFFAAGGQRLFTFSLLDGSGQPGDVNGNFGLFHADGSPKPAALVLSTLKDLLSVGSYDDPRNLNDTAPFTPSYDASALRVSGLTDAAQNGPGYLVLPKSDGSTMIALWNEPVIDDGNGQSVTPADDVVTVDFGSDQTYAIHDLMDFGAGAGSGYPDAVGRTATVTLRGYPVLIELWPR